MLLAIVNCNLAAKIILKEIIYVIVIDASYNGKQKRMQELFLSTSIYVIVIVTCHQKYFAKYVFYMYVMFLWMTVNGDLANGGLRYLSTIVHDCLRLSSFRNKSSPRKGGPKRPQKRTSVDDCANIEECGFTPPFESPI